MDALTQRLLSEQNECTLSWLAQDGRPVATIVSFVLLDQHIALTALARSGRVRAIARDPRVAITISGKGSPIGHSRCVSIQGPCEIRRDQATRDRFFPLFSRAVLPDSERGAAMMERSMNSPENLVLLVHPERVIPYDAQQGLDRANQM